MDTPTCQVDAPNLQFFSLYWDEYCDLLEGASWTDACAQWSFDSLTPERRQILPLLATRFTDQRQFLFSDPGGATSPLEIFWLKWRLFAGLCARVLTLHRDPHRPHLGLHPAQIQVMIPDIADPILPPRWNYMVKLSSPEGALPFVHEHVPPALLDRLFQPPHSVENLFQAPELRTWPLGKSEPVTALIRSMERIRIQEVEGSDVRGILHLHILTDTLPASEFSDKDVFHVHLSPLVEGAASVKVWASKVESAERGLVVSGITEPMSMTTWEHLERAQRQVFSKSQVVFYRAFHVPCDVYSLGIILLRTLIGHKAEIMSRLESTLPNMLRNLERVVKSVGTDNSLMVSERFQMLLDEQGALFSQNSLLSSAPNPSPEERLVPEDLWCDALQLAFRLIARIPGFGFCENSGDYDADYPHRRMEQVLGEITKLGEGIRLELCGSQYRNRDILNACQKLRGEFVQKEG